MRTILIVLGLILCLTGNAIAGKASALPPLKTMNLAWLTNKHGADILCMEFNRFYTPTLSTVDEGAPRLYFDLPNTVEWDAKPLYNVNSKILKKVRTSHDKKKKQARVVMDLDPKYDYSVRMSAVEEEKTFCIGVMIAGTHESKKK